MSFLPPEMDASREPSIGTQIRRVRERLTDAERRAGVAEGVTANQEIASIREELEELLRQEFLIGEDQQAIADQRSILNNRNIPLHQRMRTALRRPPQRRLEPQANILADLLDQSDSDDEENTDEEREAPREQEAAVDVPAPEAAAQPPVAAARHEEPFDPPLRVRARATRNANRERAARNAQRMDELRNQRFHTSRQQFHEARQRYNGARHNYMQRYVPRMQRTSVPQPQLTLPGPTFLVEAWSLRWFMSDLHQLTGAWVARSQDLPSQERNADTTRRMPLAPALDLLYLHRRILHNIRSWEEMGEAFLEHSSQ